MGKIKLFAWGDAVVPTGFSRVLHSIIGNLPQKNYNISWLGVNYFGDPHPYKNYRIYPAGSMAMGDPYGFNRVRDLLKLENPDIIFLLNDAWVLTKCLAIIKDAYKDSKLPKIVVYIPVDALDHDTDWYKNFEIVTKIVAYTEFGKYVIGKALPDREIEIIPHGVDNKIFYKYDTSKEEAKRKLYKYSDDFYKDSFIVLNASRNQPRKRLDITLQAFSIFAKDKPDNVKLYMHCGIVDSHINILKLASRYGIINRMIITNHGVGVQTIPEENLNLIYNATDVGLNTSVGEGWCLPCAEHSATGAPQIVPAHSALLELYKDCGIVVPVTMPHVIDNIMTTGYIANPADIAIELERLYVNKELREELGNKCLQKFTQPDYSWEKIALTWDSLFKEILK